MIDFLRALGLHAGLLHPPLDRAIPAKYEYAIQHAVGNEAVSLSLRKFTLAGCLVTVWWRDTRGKLQGHSVAGIVCADGNRLLFDSNYGEIPVDWALNADAVQQHFLDAYGGTGVHLMYRDTLYLSNAFMEAHGSDAGRCMSTAAADAIIVAPSPRSTAGLCVVAESLTNMERKPFSIVDSKVVGKGWAYLSR